MQFIGSNLLCFINYILMHYTLLGNHMFSVCTVALEITTLKKIKCTF